MYEWTGRQYDWITSGLTDLKTLTVTQNGALEVCLTFRLQAETLLAVKVPGPGVDLEDPEPEVCVALSAQPVLAPV